MPELPEVETVRRALEAHALEREIRAMFVGEQRLRRPSPRAALGRHLPGRSFSGARRRGKFLLLDVRDRGSLLVHLGMSGRVRLYEEPTVRAKHTHLTLSFAGGSEMHFICPRRFGFIDWVGEGEEAADPSLSKLGVEPLDAALDEVLPGLLRGKQTAIKGALMDQSLVAGVGNIYACEALWRAGISPRRAGARTSRPRLVALSQAVRAVLEEAISQGGTTLRDHETPMGDIGMFAQRLDVYGREGEPCHRCDGLVRRAVQGGRATFWCSGCQR